MPRNSRDSDEDMSLTNRLSLIPLRHTKTVHLVRHAHGFHNRAGERSVTGYANPKYKDAHLTPMGWQQVQRLRQHLKESQAGPRVDLVVVSPMTRALETACGLFGNLNPSAGHPLLMTAQDAIDDVRSAQGDISAEGTPPFVAIESCRERCDSHPCDQRRTRSYYQQKFPAVDFSQVTSDADALWMTESSDNGAFNRRLHAFLEILSQRPEKHIAVIWAQEAVLFYTIISTIANYGASSCVRSSEQNNSRVKSPILAACSSRTLVMTDAQN